MTTRHERMAFGLIQANTALALCDVRLKRAIDDLAAVRQLLLSFLLQLSLMLPLGLLLHIHLALHFRRSDRSVDWRSARSLRVAASILPPVFLAAFDAGAAPPSTAI